MISLYESLLADIDDTLDQGDTISAEMLANDENSLLRKVFPVNSRLKNPYEILEQNGKKMLSLKTTYRGNFKVYPYYKISSIIGNIDAIWIEGISFIYFDNNNNYSFKDVFGEKYISDQIEIFGLNKPLKDVNLCAMPARSKSGMMLQNIKLGREINNVSNCNFEIVSSSKILPITLYMSSIPTFKNVKSNTIEKIFIGYSQSLNVGYTHEVITDNIINEPIWNNIFEFGYTTTINKKKGPATVNIKDMNSIYKAICSCDFNYFSVEGMTEWPIKLKKGAKLKNLLDISKFTNLSEVVIEDNKVCILFTNTKNPPKNGSAMMSANYYWGDYIKMLPVTDDGWKVFIYKKP
jgi:hypothetical protein